NWVTLLRLYKAQENPDQAKIDKISANLQKFVKQLGFIPVTSSRDAELHTDWLVSIYRQLEEAGSTSLCKETNIAITRYLEAIADYGVSLLVEDKGDAAAAPL